jgi:hypothetical protein
MLKMLAITCELVNLSCRCHIQAITINIPLSTINIGFFKLSNLRPNKKICVSDRPTQTCFFLSFLLQLINPNIDQMYKEMKKIQTGNRSLINPFQLNGYQTASISLVKCLLLKLETERNFRILSIYYFFWHKKCLGRR